MTGLYEFGGKRFVEFVSHGGQPWQGKGNAQLRYGYGRDAEGQWWTFNLQTGWVKVAKTSRALLDTVQRYVALGFPRPVGV